MNIAFIGYRNSGKTTISKRLAKMLGWDRVETDQVIEECMQMSIPHIVEEFGWKLFRRIERKVIEKYSSENNLIIDLGGGAILDKRNMEALKKNCHIFFLDCPVDVLVKRAEANYIRPALTELSLAEEINKVLKERLPLYNKYADSTINTARKSPALCLDYINRRLAGRLAPARAQAAQAERSYDTGLYSLSALRV